MLVHLEELYLNGNRLRGAIPLEVGDLTNLSELHLYGNQLSDAMPEGLWADWMGAA